MNSTAKPRLFLSVNFLMLAAALAGWLLNSLFGHTLVTRTFNGEILQRWSQVKIYGATAAEWYSHYTLEEYLNRWDWFSTGVLVVFAVLALLINLTFFSNKSLTILQELWDRRKLFFILACILFVFAFSLPDNNPLLQLRLFFFWLSMTLGGLIFLKKYSLRNIGLLTLVSFLITAIGIYWFYHKRGEAFLELLFDEDLLVENLQVLFYSWSGILFIKKALDTRRDESLATTIKEYKFLYLMGIFLILIAAEEISWGQRILGIRTPEWLPNYQAETNIHNLTHFKARELLIAVVIFWGLLVPIAVKISVKLSAFFRSQNLPTMPWQASLCLLIGLIFYVTVTPQGFHQIKQFFEFFVSFGFLAYALDYYFKGE